MGSPDPAATLQWERAGGGISAAPSAQGMGLMGTEMEGVPREPLSAPGSGAKLGKRGHLGCPWATYQLSLLARLPWRSSGAFPALQGGIIGLSGGAQCHPPTCTRGEARGHSPAARPRRWSPPSPCSQQDPAKRARRGDSSQPSSDPINGPSRGRIPGLGVLLASSPQPLPCLPLPGAYRLALGSCHPRVAPLALWSLGGRKKKKIRAQLEAASSTWRGGHN